MRRFYAACLFAVALVGTAACGEDPPTDEAPSSSVQPKNPGGTSAPVPSPASPIESEGTPTQLPSIEPDPEADAWTLDQIVWQDRGEEGPQLLFSPPLGVTGPVARVVDEGTGPVIVEGDSVTFDYAMFAGNTGELAYSTYGTDEEQTISVQSQGMSQTFAEALIGKQVGAHVIFATIDSSQTTMAETLVTMFMAVTVTDSHAVPARAEGEPVVPDAGLPAVSLAENGAPSIEFVADSVAPHELVSQELIRGSGPAVTPGQTITIKFTAWLWDGAEFDSTWQDNASMTWPLSDGQSMPGLIEGLSGKAVGSQVLLIIPPSLGFGELEMEGIPPNSTLVYVIDILDAR